MRVAMVGLRAPWGTEGGVEHAVGQLAPRLVERGCSVTVYCRRRYNQLGEGVFEGVRLVDVGCVYSKHLEAIVHTGLAMPRALGADLVHVHATGPALWSWMPRLARRKVVVTVHGLDWQRAKWGRAARAVLQAGAWSSATFPHRVIVVGRHLQEHFREQLGRESTWIPNGVAEIGEHALAEAGVEGLEAEGYLLYVGRIVPEKGLDRLLDAYGRSGVDLPLVIVGGSTHMESYARRLREAAPPGVIFTGPLYGSRRDALLRHARAFVLPSELEGFPLAPLEAMAAARPVLLSDIPPHRELLSGAPEAGWLVSAWEDALRRVATSPDLRAMGIAGEAHVRREYSWDRVADRTLEVYRQALAGV